MKTFRFINMVALSVILALAACNKDEPLPDGSDNKIRIAATVGDFTTESGAPGTRASINGDTGTGTFEENDRIGLWVKPGNAAAEAMQTLTYNNNSWSGCTATWDDYQVSSAAPLRFTALYPDLKARAGAESATFTVETDQSTAANYEKSYLLVASQEYTAKPQNGTVALAFAHKMACLKITLKGTAAAGASIVVKDVETACTVGTDAAITLTAGNKAAITPKLSGTTFFALVPPQTLKDGLKLAITTADNNTTEHTVEGTSGKVLASGMQYPVELTLKDAVQPGSVTTAEDLIAALKSTDTQTITVASDITWNTTVTMNADKTLNIPAGKTLTFTAEGGIRTALDANGHNLTITGGGTFKLTGNGSWIKVQNSTFTLDEGTTLDIDKGTDGGTSINVYGGTFDCKGNLTAFDTGKYLLFSTYLIDVSAAGTLNLTGTIILKLEGIMGIYGSNFNIQGGTLHIQSKSTNNKYGSGCNVYHLNMNSLATINVNDTDHPAGIEDFSASGFGLRSGKNHSLTAEDGAKIIFSEGASFYQNEIFMNDRGTDVTTTRQSIIVGASNAASSATGLSAGTYVWNGSMFAKRQ